MEVWTLMLRCMVLKHVVTGTSAPPAVVNAELLVDGSDVLHRELVPQQGVLTAEDGPPVACQRFRSQQPTSTGTVTRTGLVVRLSRCKRSGPRRLAGVSSISWV